MLELVNNAPNNYLSYFEGGIPPNWLLCLLIELEEVDSMGHESGIVNGSRILEHRILVLLVKPWYKTLQPEKKKLTRVLGH